MLLANERVPSAVEIAWCIVLFRLVRNISAFSRNYVRVSSCRNYEHVSVSGADGLVNFRLAAEYASGIGRRAPISGRATA